MSLYPSVEDLEKDQSVRTEMTHQVAKAIQYDAAARAGALSSSTASSASGGLYSSIPLDESFSAYAGLDISPAALEQYMPHEVALSLASESVNAMVPVSPSSQAVALPGSQAIASVTPRNDLGLARSQIKQGLRQVVLAKDRDGKLGMALKAIDKGLFVSFVWTGKAASMSGLRFGDQVVQINGETVAGWKDDKTCKFLRNADPTRVTLVVRDRPLCRTITIIKDDLGHLGFTFRTGEITNIVKDSSAAKNGLLIHHQIIEVGGQNVVGMRDKDLLALIKSGPPSMTLTIMPSFMYKHLVKNIGYDRMKKYMDHSIPEI